MEKDELFVDNPIALVSLYSEGLFKSEELQVKAEKATVEEADTSEVNEKVQSEPISEMEAPIRSLPEIHSTVIHVLEASGAEIFIEKVIPSTMQALHKLNSNIPLDIQIIEAAAWNEFDTNQWSEHLSKDIKVISWGIHKHSLPQILPLSTPQEMLKTQESKAQHWAKIKQFFGV